MLLSFYKDLDHYKPGLNLIWKILHEKVPGLGGINFDLIIHTIIVNHLIRMPVSLFSLYDIRSFSDTLSVNQQAMDQRFELVLFGENALGEYEFIRRVNFLYKEKYKELVHQLGIKEGVFSHYQRKLELALYPNIRTEKELDDLMYKKLVEEQIYKNSPDSLKWWHGDNGNTETSNKMIRFVNKTKSLYRAVSKNCSEIHSTTYGIIRYPELNDIFLKANSIYNESVSTLSESLLQYLRMMLLLSEVVIFRKTGGFPLSDNLQLISDFNGKEMLSKDDIKSLNKNMDSTLAAYKLQCFTDYKLKFVMDDDFTTMHNHFLQKQMDFIDEQIIQIQKDIKEVLRMKSDASISKTSENQ
jgi:hypothetical protein